MIDEKIKVSKVDFYPRDWLTGTRRLTAEERGCYIDICCEIWDTGELVPDDINILSGLWVVSRQRAKKIRSALIDKKKLEKNGNFLSNFRAKEELKKAQNRIKVAKRAGRMSGVSRRASSNSAENSQSYPNNRSNNRCNNRSNTRSNNSTNYPPSTIKGDGGESVVTSQQTSPPVPNPPLRGDGHGGAAEKPLIGISGVTWDELPDSEKVGVGKDNPRPVWAWRAQLKNFFTTGDWFVEVYGSPPGEPDCSCPDDLIEWAEKKFGKTLDGESGEGVNRKSVNRKSSGILGWR